MPVIPLNEILEKMEELDTNTWNQPPGYSSQYQYQHLFKQATNKLNAQYQAPPMQEFDNS